MSFRPPLRGVADAIRALHSASGDKSEYDLNHHVQQNNVNQGSAHEENGKYRFVVDFHQ